MAPILIMPDKGTCSAKLIDERIEGAGDVFLAPVLDGFLFYSPLTNLTMLLNEFGAATIRKYFRHEDLLPDEQSLIDGLTQQIGFPTAPVHWQSAQPSAPAWAPTSVTFSNTQKCTLRCTYCYAEGGRLDNLAIPLNVAKAAIDLIMKNAMDLQAHPAIRFLGEGEATADWNVFCEIIEYFEDRCRSNRVTPAVTLNTNGVFPASYLDYVAEHCTHLTISLDGIQGVHDQHRVLPSGSGSFERVIATMKGLESRGKSYDIRSTVTLAGCTTLTEFVRFIGATLQCKILHLEPVFDVTGVTQQTEQIDHLNSHEFVERFREAKRLAADYGIDVHYSASALKLRDTFCGAQGANNFLVTSRGIVTSCNEVLQPSDPRAQLFQYGAWDEKTGEFIIDQGAIARLGHLNVHDMPKCQGCIAKYNCAGDCYAKSAATSGDPAASSYTERCQITRELLKDNLLLALLSKTVGAEIRETQRHECSF